MSAPVEGRVDGPAGGQHAGAIHDIGYRHYDGPRLGRGYARRSLFVQSLRGCYGLGRSARSKVMPMLLLVLMLAPAAIMVAVTVVAGGDELPLHYSGYALALQPVLGLYLASQAPQAISLDLRFRTVPLYFSRPIERRDYVLAKYGALTASLLVFTGLPLLVLYLGALLAKLDVVAQTTGLLKALAGAVLLKQFALVALPFLAIMLWQSGGREAVKRAAIAFLGVTAVCVLPFLIAEPGRGLVGNAGVIQTEVVLIADKGCGDARRWVYLDIGKFGGLAETMDEAIQYPIRSHRTGEVAPVILAGPTCDSADVLYERSPYSLPRDLEIGDRLEIAAAGAYTTTYAAVAFNGFEPLRSYYV